jgi:NADPH:quinone reductase-like Zn-dependent oxidoreductase
MTYEVAASLPMAGITALQGLRDAGRIETGKKVLIYGSSGGVGSFAVQIAKAFGAEVTAVCSTRKADFVRSLGADHIIDYKKEDFYRNGEKFDLILTVNGYRPIMVYRRSLALGGVCAMAGGNTRQILESLILGSLLSSDNLTMTVVSVNKNRARADFEIIAAMVEEGKIKPVIDTTYPLSQTADAMRYLEAGKARGKIVLTVP